MFDGVGVHASPTRIGSLIEPSNPFFGPAQIFFLRRDHSDQVQAIDRHDPDHAGHQATRFVAEQLQEFARNDRCFGVAYRIHTDRHPLQLVNIIDLDGFQDVLQLELGTRYQQHVALPIDGYGRLRRLDGLQHRHH